MCRQIIAGIKARGANVMGIGLPFAGADWAGPGEASRAQPVKVTDDSPEPRCVATPPGLSSRV